ncbi:MAG: MFS transporter [Candidatus Hodarchaeota archaeon]
MKNIEKYNYWRFWPIVCIAFLYPLNNAMVGLAIPIFFYRKGVNIEMIGFIAAGQAFTYSFSPILLNKISDRINRRRSVILGVVGVCCAQFVYFITLEPIPFLISRMFEGFMMGFIWANLQSSISDNTEHDHTKYIARYNFSWNFGILSGFLFGLVLLYFVDVLGYIFYIAPAIMILNSVIAILFLQESTNVNTKARTITNEINEGNNDNFADFAKYSIPIILPFFLIIAYCLGRVNANFLYPLKSEILGFEAYTVYLLAFFGFSTQIISITLSSYLSMKNLKRITVISLIAQIITSIFLAINSNFLLFILLFLFLGFFTGILYGSSLKLVLTLNIKKNTSKYSSIFESMIGLTFLIAPIFTAIIASININLAFYTLSLVFVIFLIAVLIFTRKICRYDI